jgi:hypothetical protein
MDWKNLLLHSMPPRCAATSACASILAATKKTHRMKQHQHFSKPMLKKTHTLKAT